jgi:CRP-like cAMP-binding protein
MGVTLELLRTFPVLKNLPQDLLKQLADGSVLRRCARRSVVLTAGKKEQFVCFLFEGRLQGVDFTIDGREVGLNFIEPGEFCGELGLFDQGPQPEHVIALAPSSVVFVPMDSLREVMLRSPEVVNALGAKLASRVRQMTFQRSLLGLPSISQRVCCQLWMLVPEKDKQASPDSHIANPPTHLEIAIMLNISRETVTRVFQTLQNRQIVKRDGSAKLLIRNVQILKRYAEGTEEI